MGRRIYAPAFRLAWRPAHKDLVAIMLTFIVFLPLLGALVVALLPRAQERRARELAAVVTLAAFLAALILFSLFDRSEGGFQFTERTRWIRAGEAGFDIQYFLGIDGLSVVMVGLATFLRSE